MDQFLKILSQYKEYYIPFMPLFVAAVAWWLTVVSARFKSRDEQRQKLRQVLFYLIELRKLVENSNVEKLTALMTRTIAEVMKEELSETQKGAFRLFMLPLTKQFLSAQLPEAEEREKCFNEAVATLAVYKPWLAYSLNGKHAILRHLTVLEKWLDELPLDQEPSEQERQFVNGFIRNSLLDKSGLELERLILEVAWVISFKQILITKWKLRKLNDFQYVKEYIQELALDMKQQIDSKHKVLDSLELV